MVTNKLNAKVINPNLTGEIILQYPNQVSLTGILEFLSAILGENTQEPNLPKLFTLDKVIFQDISPDIYAWTLSFISQDPDIKDNPSDLRDLLDIRGIGSIGEDHISYITTFSNSYILTIVGCI